MKIRPDFKGCGMKIRPEIEMQGDCIKNGGSFTVFYDFINATALTSCHYLK